MREVEPLNGIQMVGVYNTTLQPTTDDRPQTKTDENFSFGDNGNWRGK